MNRVDLNRRRFLKLVGATALTYPFLRGVPGYAAGSNGGTNPIYLVLLFTANGCVRYRWGAQGPAPASLAPTATAVTNGPLTFRQTLSAFTKAGPSQQADLTKYITVLDGLQNKAAGGGTHESGMASLWTGLTVAQGNPATGPSIDQAIAGQLMGGTPFPSVGLMVQSKADYQQRSVDTRMLYDLSGNWVDPIPTPAQAMSLLFPKPTASSGPDKKTFIRQQVWNHINGDLTSLQKRLCTDDRIQLQNLQDMWNQVLMQLQAAASKAATCMTPSTDAGAGTGVSASCVDPFPMNAQIMPNILAMTLACNLTQVASLQYSHALSPATHCWLGSSQTDTHHNYSHMTPSTIFFLAPDLYNPSPSVMSQYPQQLIDIETWYAQQVANLAYTFSTVQSGSGTLLDQSVICWGSEIDMGLAHNHDDTPFVLIGGAGGKLKCTQTNGQLVRFPLNLTGSSVDNNKCGIRFHNDLLITLAQIMGVSTAQLQTAYGSTNWGMFQSYAGGPITEILSA
jgi:uncharacterized protein DUF1552